MKFPFLSAVTSEAPPPNTQYINDLKQMEKTLQT